MLGTGDHGICLEKYRFLPHTSIKETLILLLQQSSQDHVYKIILTVTHSLFHNLWICMYNSRWCPFEILSRTEMDSQSIIYCEVWSLQLTLAAVCAWEGPTVPLFVTRNPPPTLCRTTAFSSVRDSVYLWWCYHVHTRKAQIFQKAQSHYEFLGARRVL